jgi:hypothetical protein
VPFWGPTPVELVEAITSRPHAPIPPQSGGSLIPLVDRMLAKSPTQRPSVDDLLRDPLFASPLRGFIESYRPLYVEERQRRAQVRDLRAQTEGILGRALRSDQSGSRGGRASSRSVSTHGSGQESLGGTLGEVENPSLAAPGEGGGAAGEGGVRGRDDEDGSYSLSDETEEEGEAEGVGEGPDGGEAVEAAEEEADAEGREGSPVEEERQEGEVVEEVSSAEAWFWMDLCGPLRGLFLWQSVLMLMGRVMDRRPRRAWWRAG